MKRDRVAMFTPLPPARTGTADYAAELIPELEKLVDLQVFDGTPKRFDPSRFDSVVYQIGNNPFHADIYKLALRVPGVAVLHEANLHDLIRGLSANRRDAYMREVYYEIYGEDWRGEGDSARAVADVQPAVFSMIRRLLDSASACIVHSRFAENAIRMKGYRGRVGRIRHGISLRTPDAAAYRQKLGIAWDAPLLGIFGYLRPDKQAAESLAMFRALLDSVPDAHLAIAGAAHPEVPLDRLISSPKLKSNVHLLGFQEAEDLDGLIAACDVVLNLRWPTFGETSGIAARAFGMGKTVVSWERGADLDVPADACVRIPYDRHRDAVLVQTLQWLCENRQAAAEVGARARKWAEAECSWPKIAADYAHFLADRKTNAISAVAASPAAPAAEELDAYLRQWVEAGTPRASYLEEHRNRLVRTLQLTPAGNGSARILELGCYLQITPALRDVLSYGEVRGSYLGAGPGAMKSVRADSGEVFECRIDLFDCERDAFPYPDARFSTVLCCELLEHLERDPMRMMTEIHRVLEPGGILVLTTPNIVSARSLAAVLAGNHPGYYARYPNPSGSFPPDPGHRREYTPSEIQALMTAAGFVVDHIETGPYGPVSSLKEPGIEQLLKTKGLSSALRDDCIFAVGRKELLPVNRFPSWLYD